MILHVAELEKFIPPLVDLIKSDFDQRDHYFWLFDYKREYSIEQNDRIFLFQNGFWEKVRAYLKLIMKLHSADKVMLHGLFDIRVIFILTFLPWILPKCYWLIWGGDLYRYRRRRSTFTDRIREVSRRFVIQRVGHLVTYIPGDLELARKWYGARGKHHECLMYLSNTIGPQIEPVVLQEVADRGSVNILVGNSADPTNNHIDSLQKLLSFKDHDLKIYAPLSYGDKSHAEKVIEVGKAWFGDRFVPITQLMSPDDYYLFLQDIDIAIFNHDRQQAMGNTIALLGMGKAVYMRSNVSHWDLFQAKGIEVFDIEDINLSKLDKNTALRNIEKIKSYFSKESLVDQYSRIFSP